MKPTSHFIALSLSPKILADLYISLYEYAQQHDILRALSFQSANTPHTTLAYFEAKITDNQYYKIRFKTS